MKKKVFPIRQILFLILGLIMTIQIVLGLSWMVVNLTNIPIFGDSTEYYQLSQTLQVDEYRPILYPLLIRIADRIAGHLPLEYQSLVYIGQTLLCILSTFFLTEQIAHFLFASDKKKRTIKFHLIMFFISLYITCIPMITFMNFSVLTDSIATSMLMLTIGSLIRIFGDSFKTIRYFILIMLSMLVEYTIRADRLYTCTLFLVIVFVIWLINKHHEKFFRRNLILALCTVLISTGAASAINKTTQHPGLYGRIPTTLGFVLLDRVVWPNMTQNYDDFSDEIKSLVSKKDARQFDKHNNNVMYQMAPLLREKAGEEQAEEIYKEMASVVFRNQPGKVITDILEDITCVIFTPISAFLSSKGLVKTADAWNLHCVSQSSPALSTSYYNYYLNIFMVLFLISCLIMLIRFINKKRMKKKSPKENSISHLLAPGFVLCITIALWFSIGDGAPPNDRYALLHYVIWTLWVLGILSPELFSYLP